MNKKPISEAIFDSNQSGVEFLLTDAKVALTFLDLAETTHIADYRSRRIEEAHRAYQTILSFLPRVIPTEEQMQILSRELETIRARLQAAGVSID